MLREGQRHERMKSLVQRLDIFVWLERERERMKSLVQRRTFAWLEREVEGKCAVRKGREEKNEQGRRRMILDVKSRADSNARISWGSK